MTDTLTREHIEKLQDTGAELTFFEHKELCRLALKALDPPAPPSPDVVEKVAKAIFMADGGSADQFDDYARDSFAVMARAAITALGWKGPQ